MSSLGRLQVLAISTALVASAACAPGQFGFGISIVAPPAPLAYRVPPQPGEDYVWIEGYWYPTHGRYLWHDGYWTRPPYEGAYWVGPYYVGGQYFAGYWEGDRGRLGHNHRWDRSRERDEHHR